MYVLTRPDLCDPGLDFAGFTGWFFDHLLSRGVLVCRCAEDAVVGGRRNAMSLGDLPQALAAAAITEDGFPIDGDRLPSNVPALELRASHAGFHSFDNQVAFEFGDRTDDDHNGPHQRNGRIDAFAERDELN